jgi:hypothetical protein
MTKQKKLFVGIDAKQLTVNQLDKSKAGLNSVRCSQPSENIEDIRNWARARMSRGAAHSVFIFSAVEELAPNKQAPTPIS